MLYTLCPIIRDCICSLSCLKTSKRFTFCITNWLPCLKGCLQPLREFHRILHSFLSSAVVFALGSPREALQFARRSTLAMWPRLDSLDSLDSRGETDSTLEDRTTAGGKALMVEKSLKGIFAFSHFHFKGCPPGASPAPAVVPPHSR